MATTYEYVFVIDNNSVLCVDNARNSIIISATEIAAPTLEVRRIKNKLYPCFKCKYQNSMKFPATDIHGQQQRSKNYLANLNSGYNSAYAEILGECTDFVQQT